MTERMTAKEAMALTKANRVVRDEVVAALVDAWTRVIRRAAEMGLTEVLVNALPVLRMPVTDDDRQAAWAEMRRLGYAVGAGTISWEVED